MSLRRRFAFALLPIPRGSPLYRHGGWLLRWCCRLLAVRMVLLAVAVAGLWLVLATSEGGDGVPLLPMVMAHAILAADTATFLLGNRSLVRWARSDLRALRGAAIVGVWVADSLLPLVPLLSAAWRGLWGIGADRPMPGGHDVLPPALVVATLAVGVFLAAAAGLVLAALSPHLAREFHVRRRLVARYVPTEASPGPRLSLRCPQCRVAYWADTWIPGSRVCIACRALGS